MESIQVRTADDVRLTATHVTRTGPGDDGLAIVVAHGFTVPLQRPSLQRVMTRLARVAGVVGVDFRGHGRSGGATTAGDLEVLDLDAAVRLARELGYRRIATVGFSMGGAVVVRHAARSSASGGFVPAQAVDAVVAVSVPSRWYIRETKPMRRVHWILETPTGHRLAARALRTRIGGVWGVPPEWPLKAIPRIPVPVLVIHGDQDAYFGVAHGRALAAARPGTDYWELEGFGHAEGPLRPEQVDRIAAWVVDSVGTVRP